MPDRTKLRIGDEIRLQNVPQADLDQRAREIHEGLADAGWTADAIERILSACPIVIIDRIDEYGTPWFDVELIGNDGETEYHSLAVMDDDSWAYLPG